MAQTNLTDWKIDLDSKVYENTSGLITATNVNQLLTDLADSVVWSVAQQGYDAVTTSPTVITFLVAMPDANYNIQVTPIDAQGDPIDVAITNILTTGFTLTGAVAGNVYWRVTS